MKLIILILQTGDEQAAVDGDNGSDKEEKLPGKDKTKIVEATGNEQATNYNFRRHKVISEGGLEVVIESGSNSGSKSVIVEGVEGISVSGNTEVIRQASNSLDNGK